MNKLATIVPVFGIGALVSGVTLMDDNASNVKSLSTGFEVVPVGVDCSSYKNVEPPVKRMLSVVASSALK